MTLDLRFAQGSRGQRPSFG
uniref:Uncharacterized protein n=1 Tax=Rhizophora mucronata TaxID=61149 RepID=A0A2P2PVR2_RHIMU